DQDAVVLIPGQLLGIEEFVLEGLQGIIVQGELHFKCSIRHTAPLAQERNDLIYHRDKVHPVSPLRLRRQRAPSLTGALPWLRLCLCPQARLHHSIDDRASVAGTAEVGRRMLWSREKVRGDKVVRPAGRTGDTGYRPITGYRRIAQAAGSLPWLRAIIERDLKDGRIPGSCPQDGHIIEAELRIVRDHRELGML